MSTLPKPNSAPPIASIGEAQHAIANLERIMDALLATVEEETALVRSGRVTEAARIEEAKSELAGRYLAETERLKANKNAMKADAKREERERARAAANGETSDPAAGEPEET